MTMSRLPPSANTRLDEHGLIFGEDFGDGYFSRDDGLGESQTVFLQGNNLPQAWADHTCFVIGELGFGTGLNVLATWDLWRKNRPKGGILHIITVEGFLLDVQAARAMHKRWPELAHLSDKLTARWPTRAHGAQRVWFGEDGICLTFLIGPCEDALSRMEFQANCWFLDGFSPAKNPDMWSAAIFAQIARLSAPNATIATYTVAAFVRAGLAAVGFDVQKAPGFGSKRERLIGRLAASPTKPIEQRPQRAIVIGGGIAGAGACAALIKRNIQVEQFDDDPCGRTKASANPLALVMPRLDLADTREARFFRASYLMAIDNYHQMGTSGFSQTGVLEVPDASGDAARLTSLATDPPLPSDHIQETDGQGLFHAQAGLVFPDEILRYLTRGVTCHPIAIARINCKDGLWCAYDGDDNLITSADICIIANGMAARAFCDFGLELRPRAGQLSWARLAGEALETPISGGSYAAPFGAKLMFGATYEHCDINAPFPAVTLDSHERNRDTLGAIAPDLASRIDIDSVSGRKSVRATTPDNMPIFGAVGDQAGLFVLTALGSRGFTTAFLGAEIIASLACHEPSPVERQIGDALAPNRFILRAAKRGKPVI
jgi:tRNA 5-methylaminomethyl-2-thiouridine biosynthesis bifunctional protein